MVKGNTEAPPTPGKSQLIEKHSLVLREMFGFKPVKTLL
jgi:hypothetical protein